MVIGEDTSQMPKQITLCFRQLDTPSRNWYLRCQWSSEARMATTTPCVLPDFSSKISPQRSRQSMASIPDQDGILKSAIGSSMQSLDSISNSFPLPTLASRHQMVPRSNSSSLGRTLIAMISPTGRKTRLSALITSRLMIPRSR